MRACLDEGILQSYFDGELSTVEMESATSHLTVCGKCAALARELENEANLLRTALAPEFDAPVPTEYLRRRIDNAIAELSSVSQKEDVFASANRAWLRSLTAIFAFTPQRAFGYAGLVVVLAIAALFGTIWRQKSTPSAPIAQTYVPIVKTGPIIENAIADKTSSPVQSPPVTPRRTVGKPHSVKPRANGQNQAVPEVKLLPGERSYLKTIAALDSTIKANSNRPMRPALQAEYERNLAVVNRALAATRSAAKKNPNDPDAVEFMFAAYQSKLDLLNTVADARDYNRQQ